MSELAEFLAADAVWCVSLLGQLQRLDGGG